MSEPSNARKISTENFRAVQAHLDRELFMQKGPLGHPKDCAICLEDLSGEVVKLCCEIVFHCSFILKWESFNSAGSSKDIDLSPLQSRPTRFLRKLALFLLDLKGWPERESFQII